MRFTIAYATGLVPALLARFAWKREPIEPALATGIAGASGMAFYLLSRFLIEPGDPQIMTSGFMWALVFIASRSIMTGGYKKQPMSTE